MKTAGYKNVLVNVQALNPQDEIVDIGYTTIKTGVAWDAQWEYKAGTNSDFLIDVSAWCENLSDDESNVAIFTARNSSGANVNTDFRIELKGFYEEGQADRFNENPKQIGVFDEAGEKGLYVRFKYITSGNTRALIWGKTSSKIIYGPAFAECTDLSAVPGYGAGWYEFYLVAGSLDNDNALWLASDSDTRALISFGYTSAAI